jgi:hypothetical protein
MMALEANGPVCVGEHRRAAIVTACMLMHPWTRHVKTPVTAHLLDADHVRHIQQRVTHHIGGTVYPCFPAFGIKVNREGERQGFKGGGVERLPVQHAALKRLPINQLGCLVVDAFRQPHVPGDTLHAGVTTFRSEAVCYQSI